MGNSVLRTQVRIQQAWRELREEYGQTMVEYAGIAFVALAIIMVVIGAVSGENAKGIADAITGKIANAINDLSSDGK